LTVILWDAGVEDRLGEPKGIKDMSREIMVNIPELVQYITWLASEREEMLSPIGLVKFIENRRPISILRKNSSSTGTF
jgi:hypothetical protein